MKNSVFQNQIINKTAFSLSNNYMFRIFTLILLTMLLNGCFLVKPTPATRIEALKAFKADTGSSIEKQKFTSKFNYDKTLIRLNELTKRCLNFNIEISSHGGVGGPHGIWSYSSNLKKINTNYSEFTMQKRAPDALNLSNQPKGGYFYMIANIKRNKKGLADITLYGPKNKDEELFNSIIDWSTSNKNTCPVDFDN